MASPRAPIRRLLSGVSCPHLRSYSAAAIPTNKQKYIPEQGTYPKGFLLGTSHAGVKPSNTDRDDITFIASEKPCFAYATVTKNAFKAAPVRQVQTALAKRGESGFGGVIINSGCANAVTGAGGMQDAEKMASVASECVTGKADFLVMSTGVIGQRLPMDRIEPAIPKAHAATGGTHEHWSKAATAITTTDTFPKLISRSFTLPSHPETRYSIAGIVKGAGMIHPNMGTLLGVVCTDAPVAPPAGRKLLLAAVDRSFNCISIDGDTSTNDTVCLLANGMAAPSSVEPITVADSEDGAAFSNALSALLVDLAKLVVRDGEGATKFVTIRVRSDVDGIAKSVASSIAQSSLVKTALYGKDANWGRILCAIGYNPRFNEAAEHARDDQIAGQIKPERVSVSFVPSDGSKELKLVVKGEPQQVDEDRAKEILELEDLEILVNLADSPSETGNSEQNVAPKIDECLFWTCDLSHEYVTINGDYRT